MNVKKVLPVLLLIIMAVITLFIKRCNSNGEIINNHSQSSKKPTTGNTRADLPSHKNSPALDRRATNLFFSKHAKCRMKCRHITEQEVRDILANGTINYKKSNLNDVKGPTYAVEGYTSDNQHVRIIFAPKQSHITVVTVIDLEVEYTCDCS